MKCTAADGKTEVFNIPGYPLMVRAVDFNAAVLAAAQPQGGPAAPELDDFELENMAHGANQEALSFGIGLDVFLRLAKDVRSRMQASQPPTQGGGSAGKRDCDVCGEGKTTLLVTRYCDTCECSYAGDAEMKMARALRDAEAAPAQPPAPAVAKFMGRRLTPAGTAEFWGLLLCDPKDDPAEGALLQLVTTQEAAPTPPAPQEKK